MHLIILLQFISGIYFISVCEPQPAYLSYCILLHPLLCLNQSFLNCSISGAPSPFTLLQIIIHNVLEDRLTPLRSGHPSALETAGLSLGAAGNPPRCEGDNNAAGDDGHGGAERGAIAGREAGAENLGADSAADLAVAVDEADGESGPCRPARRLHAPWPHCREPRRRSRVPDQCCCVHRPGARIRHRHRVASQDHNQEAQRVYRPWEPPVIGEYSRHPDDDQA